MKGSQRREAILATAAPIFNRNGFAGTSISEILEAASLEKGGLYNHFASKEALAIASFDYAWSSVGAHFARAIGGNESGAPRLRAYIDAFERYVERPVVAGGCPLVNSALQVDDALPFLRDRVRAAFEEFRAFVLRQAHRAVEKGHFAAGTDAEAVADFTIAALQGAFVLARGLRSRDSLRRAIAMLREWLASLAPDSIARRERA